MMTLPTASTSFAVNMGNSMPRLSVIVFKSLGCGSFLPSFVFSSYASVIDLPLPMST